MAIDKLIDNVLASKTQNEMDAALKQLTQYADANGLRSIAYESEVDRYAPATKYTVSYTKVIDEARGSGKVTSLENAGRYVEWVENEGRLSELEGNEGKLDEEIEEILEIPDLSIAPDPIDDKFHVTVDSGGQITIEDEDQDNIVILEDAAQAERLLDKLSWAIEGAVALKDRVPF